MQRKGLGSIDELRKDGATSATSATSHSEVVKWKNIRVLGKNVQARLHGKSLGVFSDAKVAVQAVIHKSAGSVSDLKKPKLEYTDPDEQLERFRILWQVYDGGVPGDLESMRGIRQQNPTMVTECPVLYILLLRGKDGPWHESIANEFKKLTREQSNTLSMVTSSVPSEKSKACNLLYDTLVRVALAIKDWDRKAWSKNVGRNVSSHSGWLAVLRTHGIIKLTKTCLLYTSPSPRD